MEANQGTLAEGLIAGLVDGDLTEYGRYGDLDFSMRRGAAYLRELALTVAERASIAEAPNLWLLSVRYQSIWRYIYQWLSWQPSADGLQHQEATVEALRDRLTTADLATARAAFAEFRRAMRRFPCPGGKEEEVERGLDEAFALVEQRWDQLEVYRQRLETLLAGCGLPELRRSLDRIQLLSNWMVLRQLMEKKGFGLAMPQAPNGPPGAPLFARRVMEVLDAANQMPRPAALYSAAHEFEKYPRLLVKLLPNAESPLEAIDLWFAKLLREEEIRYSTLARLYVAFDDFRRFARSIDPHELDRLIRYLGNSAILFAFQYAFERDQTDQFRRGLGGQLDLKDEPGTLQRLVNALTALYERGGWAGVEASLQRLIGTGVQPTLDSLREVASSLVGKEERDNSAVIEERARVLLEQTLRLAIYRPAVLRAAEAAEDETPAA